MVAYLLFARGQLLRLHRPVTLYSLRQKFCTCVFDLKLQWPWLMTCDMHHIQGLAHDCCRPQGIMPKTDGTGAVGMYAPPAPPAR